MHSTINSTSRRATRHIHCASSIVYCHHTATMPAHIEWRRRMHFLRPGRTIRHQKPRIDIAGRCCVTTHLRRDQGFDERVLLHRPKVDQKHIENSQIRRLKAPGLCVGAQFDEPQRRKNFQNGCSKRRWRFLELCFRRIQQASLFVKPNLDEMRGSVLVVSTTAVFYVAYLGTRWRGQGTKPNSWGHESTKLKICGRKKSRSVFEKCACIPTTAKAMPVT